MKRKELIILIFILVTIISAIPPYGFTKDSKSGLVEDRLSKNQLTSGNKNIKETRGGDLIIGTETVAFWFDNPIETREAVDVINNLLKIKNVKLRLDQFKMAKDEKGRFKPYVCRLDLRTNQKACELGMYNLDKVVDVFVKNDWNMCPMFSQQNEFFCNRRELNDEIIDEYVEWIDWFLGRYYKKVSIPYIEPGNNPANNWRGGKASPAQLVRLQNMVYDKIKRKYPNLIITSPGFEFHSDEDNKNDWANNLLAYFLDPNSGAKFDALAIHGFPPSGGILPFPPPGKIQPKRMPPNLRSDECRNGFCYYPPTKKTIYNKYAGIAGILELRKKLDENGWHDRKIFDTEHWLILPRNRGNIVYTEKQDELVAAVNVQDFLLRKTLKHNGQFILSGINTMLIGRRGVGIKTQGSLMPDGTMTKHLKAIAFLWAKLGEYNYYSRLSGEFNDDGKPWVEKFKIEEKELYIFFKPFKYKIGENRPFVFDSEILKFELRLAKRPSRLTLFDMLGNDKTLSAKQHITLEIKNAPHYLEVIY